MVKPVVTPRRRRRHARRHARAGLRLGVLFGPERTGLENDDVALADTVLTVPLNPDYCSLNLAQCGAAGRLRVVPGRPSAEPPER